MYSAQTPKHFFSFFFFFFFFFLVTLYVSHSGFDMLICEKCSVIRVCNPNCVFENKFAQTCNIQCKKKKKWKNLGLEEIKIERSKKSN